MSMTRVKKKEVTLVQDSSGTIDVKKSLPPRKRPDISFDAWWVLAQKRHGFSPALKEAVYMHFRARGFLSSGDFEEGLVDFGVKS